MAQATSNDSTVRPRIQKKTADARDRPISIRELWRQRDARWVGDMLEILKHPEIQRLMDRQERELSAAIYKVWCETRGLRALPGGKA